MDEAKDSFEVDGDYIILDVGEIEEYEEGHIPGAINIPLSELSQDEIMNSDVKDKQIYIYCRSGNRSAQACEKLAFYGYTELVDFGGILDWSGEIDYSTMDVSDAIESFLYK